MIIPPHITIHIEIRTEIRTDIANYKETGKPILSTLAKKREMVRRVPIIDWLLPISGIIPSGYCKLTHSIMLYRRYSGDYPTGFV